jgi:hypothetical protein|tara:strand:- start:7607 stop:7927 length:321 start_codon:yes stop_codon:yes gene_type:complete
MDDIGFIGFIDLDATLPVAIQCRNSSGVPTTPASAPTYTVYPPGFSAYIATGSLDASDKDSKTGFRTGSIAATSSTGYETNKLYTVIYEYTADSQVRASIGTFMVT